MARNNNGKENNGPELDFEEKLWKAADKLRSNMDAAEYKHVVLGLIFLKYISDAFSEVHERAEEGSRPPIQRTGMNMFPEGCFGYQRRRDGTIWRRTQRNPR